MDVLHMIYIHMITLHIIYGALHGATVVSITVMIHGRWCRGWGWRGYMGSLGWDKSLLPVCYSLCVTSHVFLCCLFASLCLSVCVWCIMYCLSGTSLGSLGASVCDVCLLRSKTCSWLLTSAPTEMLVNVAASFAIVSHCRSLFLSLLSLFLSPSLSLSAFFPLLSCLVLSVCLLSPGQSGKRDPKL